MDGNIYSISILNFNSEIGFFVKRPEFPSYISENFSQQITKFIFKNYLCKHPSQRYFYVSMEHSISSKLRAKISLTGKLCIIIIFSSLLDIHYINLFHDGIKNNKLNDKAKFKLTPKLVGYSLKKKEKRKKLFLDEINNKENNNDDEKKDKIDKNKN